MKEYIDKSAVLAYPLRRETCDNANANSHFVNGVESVMEYVEDLPTVSCPQWISVEDKLPEGTEYVLVAAPWGNGSYDILVGVYFLGYGWCEVREMMHIDEVTHWMPLPNPPKV